MGVELIKGNLFAQNVDAIVNPVNCKGSMGNGLAAVFKRRHPAMYADYRRVCLAGNLRPGKLHTWNVTNRRWIINLPTKDEYWDSQRNPVPSRPEYIVAGLNALVIFALGNRIESIALPALGCGKGQLHLCDIEPLIAAAAQMDEVIVRLVIP